MNSEKHISIRFCTPHRCQQNLQDSTVSHILEGEYTPETFPDDYTGSTVPSSAIGICNEVTTSVGMDDIETEAIGLNNFVLR